MTYCKLPKLKHTICKSLNLLPKAIFEVIPIFKIMTFSGISRNKYDATISVKDPTLMLDQCGSDNAHELHQHTKGT
jgi:hypothetical protein